MVHIEILKTNLQQAKTCPSLQRAIIETISVHCGIVVTGPFSPLFTSVRANQIIQTIAEQEALLIIFSKDASSSHFLNRN
jgi:hypothetical protein